MAALAKDHRNDIFAASGAALGIFLSRNGLPWGDPLAGAIVALLVLRTGIMILSDASAELMDTVPGDELAEQVQALLADVPGVMCVEEVYAHRFGPYLVMNVTVGIDGSLSVAAGDSIASAVERRLYDRIDLLRRVHVHYHPEGVAQLPNPASRPRTSSMLIRASIDRALAHLVLYYAIPDRRQTGPARGSGTADGSC